MFNFELISSEGIYQICDDVFSEVITEKEAKECVIQLIKDLKENNAVLHYKDVSFNVNTYFSSEEEKTFVKKNIRIYWYEISKLSDSLSDTMKKVC